ncbi:cupin domain-containing protein [Allostreptomyces psammosilenae]|uniref:Mannose-6-phosphate isomerase-like protein (Cupin superfamily) n=1 Tax=Allostreptomyces psammosilenae TaxID=1892865 RepID=A0A853A4D0_9ACTN|nr:cupin domain-containing protein [Allostreptomyces psammosilenae]NYI07734.1 mannose-6-phosphate isomerase-like protein (cupin superfamily) [Allostreptomyces psammosilenae]
MDATTAQHQNPVLVRAADAETLRDGATSLITLLADAGATGGALTANRATFRAGSPGAPAHFHTRATEMFFVLGGRMRILVNEEVLSLGPGDFLTVPPTVPHAFAPAPGEEGDMLVVFTPGLRRFDYYRLLERVYRGEATVQEIRDSSEEYDNHYFDSPVWRQALTER